MNRLTTAKRAAVVAALVAGCTIRATVRMSGVAKDLARGDADAGSAWDFMQDVASRFLP